MTDPAPDQRPNLTRGALTLLLVILSIATALRF